MSRPCKRLSSELDIVTVLNRIVLGSDKKVSTKKSPAEEEIELRLRAKRNKREVVNRTSKLNGKSVPEAKDDPSAKSLKDHRSLLGAKEEQIYNGVKPSDSGGGSQRGVTWLDEARKKKYKGLNTTSSDGPPVQCQLSGGGVTVAKTGTISLTPVPSSYPPVHHEGRCTKVGFHHASSLPSHRLTERPSLLWSTGRDGDVKFCRIERKRFGLTSQVQLGPGGIRDASINSDNTKLICLQDNSRIQFVDIESQRASNFVPVNVGNDLQVRYTKFMVGERIICLLDETGRIHHMDERTGRSYRTYNSGSLMTSMVISKYNPRRMIAGDDSGELFEWDLGIGRCINRQRVEGVLSITAMATSGKGQLLVGSKCGYVSSIPVSNLAIKTRDFGNLTTPVDVIAGHTAAQLGIIASTSSNGAVRLIHVGEKGFSYQNWPGDRGEKLGHVSAASFSEGGGLFCVANTSGVVKVWEAIDLASCLVADTFM